MPQGESEDDAIFLSISCSCLSFNEKERKRECKSTQLPSKECRKRTKGDSRRRINKSDGNRNKKFSQRYEVESVSWKTDAFLRSKERKHRYRKERKGENLLSTVETLGLNRFVVRGNSIGNATVTSVATLPPRVFDSRHIFPFH